MPVSHCTAVATPFRSVVTIYNIERNIIIKTSLFKDLSELEEGVSNSHKKMYIKICF